MGGESIDALKQGTQSGKNAQKKVTVTRFA